MGKENLSVYLIDVIAEDREFVAPYLTLCRDDAAQRECPLRAVFNAVLHVARTSGQ